MSIPHPREHWENHLKIYGGGGYNADNGLKIRDITNIIFPIIAHPDLDGKVSGISPSHTNDLKNGNYCSTACAGRNELE